MSELENFHEDLESKEFSKLYDFGKIILELQKEGGNWLDCTLQKKK